MKEGEPVLGGPQVTPGNVQPANPGVQPTGFETLQNTQNTQPTPLTPPPSQAFAPNNISANGAQFSNPLPQPTPQSSQFQAQPQFPIQSAPLASGTEDIMLGTTPPKKSKKGLIIVAILLALTLTIVIIGTITLSGNIGMGGDSAKDSLENFIGYLTNGTKDNYDNISEFSAKQTYAIDRYFQDTDTVEAEAYFEELNNIWQSFAETKHDESDQNSITIINEDLDALDSYFKEKNISKNEILNQYIREGEDSVSFLLPGYFVKDNYDPSDILSQYMAAWNDYLNKLIDLFDNYIENGCVVGGNLDENCIRNKDLYQQETYEQFEISKEALKNYAYELKDEIKEQTSNLLTSMERKNDS